MRQAVTVTSVVSKMATPGMARMTATGTRVGASGPQFQQQHGQDEAEEQAAGVAHVDPRRVEVRPQEPCRTAGERHASAATR